MWHTLSEGQQQQWRQSGDDGREQKHAAPTKAIDRQADEDAGKSPHDHSDKVAEVEVDRITVKVSGEAVLDSRSNEAGGEMSYIVRPLDSYESHHFAHPKWKFHADSTSLS